MLKRADLLNEIGYPQKALPDLDVCIKQKPNHYYTYRMRAETYAMLKRWADAEKDFDKSIALGPDYGAFLGRANCRAKLKEWAKVVEDTTQVLKIGSPAIRGRALKLRCQANIELKQYQNAITDCKLLLKISPDERPTHDTLRKLYEQVGNKEGAFFETAKIKSLDADL